MAPAGSSQLRLGNEFLAGTWCSMIGGAQATLVFPAVGQYEPSFPANEPGYVQFGPERPTGGWLDSFVANESQDPDEMVLRNKRGGRMVFRRGECADNGG
jgi:hypothetical protein